MELREQIVKEGNWLFRYRGSLVPLLLIMLFLPAVRNFAYPGHSHRLNQLWEIGCLGISLLGLGVRIYTIGCTPRRTSSRNTAKQASDVLNTTGMYSIVRHPLYLGNFLILLGISLSVLCWWFTFITILLYWLCYERIMLTEEGFLRGKWGNTFLKWAEETPCILPKFRNWKSPSLPFSLKAGIKKEYHRFFIIVAAFTFIDVIKERIVQGKFVLDLPWEVMFPFALFTYILIGLLKKTTKVLAVEGR